MVGFLIRVLITALGLWIASALLGGVHMQGFAAILGSALLLGIVNAIIRPILVLLTLPFTIVTLGLFLFVVNAAMVGLVAKMLNGFAIDGFGSALLTAIIVTITGWAGNAFVGSTGRFEALVIRRR